MKPAPPAGAPPVVDHPPHYQAAGLQCIEVIEKFGLGYHLGNVVKYILRADRKGEAIADLQKAAWYLAREIARREQGREQG
jgi:hypothetical protein